MADSVQSRGQFPVSKVKLNPPPKHLSGWNGHMERLDAELATIPTSKKRYWRVCQSKHDYYCVPKGSACIAQTNRQGHQRWGHWNMTPGLCSSRQLHILALMVRYITHLCDDLLLLFSFCWCWPWMWLDTLDYLLLSDVWLLYMRQLSNKPFLFFH